MATTLSLGPLSFRALSFRVGWAAVALVGGRCKTEASGGVTLETIAGIAATGVDFISAGGITQSAPAVDIGLDFPED